MISVPNDLPDDPVLLKQLLLGALMHQAKKAVVEVHEIYIADVKGQIKLLRERIFGRDVTPSNWVGFMNRLPLISVPVEIFY